MSNEKRFIQKQPTVCGLEMISDFNGRAGETLFQSPANFGAEGND